MDAKKELVIVLWVIVLVGAFFLAKGITGNAIGNTSSDYCTKDMDCVTGKVCCVNANGIGMCNQNNFLCDRLTDNKAENPMKKSYFFEIILGILILFCALVALYANDRGYGKKKKGKKTIRKRR